MIPGRSRHEHRTSTVRSSSVMEQSVAVGRRPTGAPHRRYARISMVRRSAYARRMRELLLLSLSAIIAIGGVVTTVALPLPHDDAADPLAPPDEQPDPPEDLPPAGAQPDDGSSTDTDDVPVESSSWGDAVEGLLRFRGNLTMTDYGRGPLPDNPEIAWRFPESAMCITENITVEETDEDGETVRVPTTREWCGTGWTGQPIVWDRDDGVTEIIFGSFDGRVYFLDGDTGDQLRAPFQTGFQIKGTGALDPDGYPIFYIGSRDGQLRALALDREPVEELWSLSPHPQRVWNDDWDGSPAILDDVLYVGGEDSWFRAVRLHRDYDDDGRVTVDPEVLVELPGFTDELFAQIGDRNVSIENSVAIDVARDRLAFANSGGRVVVLRLSELAAGRAEILLDVWLGDDIDASIVIDPADGALYVAIELQRFLPRAFEVGQLVRLDVEQPDNPIVWSIDVPPRQTNEDGGLWATPALHNGLLYAITHPGELLVVDTADGTVLFRDDVGWHAWSSPVIVGDGNDAQLLVATCTDPQLRAYDLADPAQPSELWRIGLPGCIESTPAVWDGRIWVGSRDGFFYAIR